MSYQAVKQITTQLEATFALFDAQIADGTVEYLKKCAVEVQAVKRANPKLDCWSLYPKLYAAAGGKGNFQLIQYGVSTAVEAVIRRSEKLKADKRNIRIAAKLQEAGITQVTDTEVCHSPSGFNGIFDVATDKGPKKVIVETIFAHGEVQCPHFRVLVKVK